MEHNNFYREISDKIRALMSSKGVSITELSEEIGVSTSFLAKFLNHGTKISAERMNQILNALGYEITFQEKKTLLNPA